MKHSKGHYMYFNRNCLNFLFSIIILSLFLSLNLTCTSREKPEALRYTVSGEQIPNDSLKNQLNINRYQLKFLYYEMVLSANGQLSVIEQGGGSYKMTVFQDTSLSLNAVEYSTFEKDLILIYELKNGSDGWSEIARINLEERKMIWKTRFGGFNLSKALIQGKYLYGSTIGYVGKFNLKTGKIVWQKNDLWEKYKVNNFESIHLKKDTVVFVGRVYEISNKTTMVRKTVPFIYNKRNGKEITK